MAKKTLAISATEAQYNNIHKQLNEHNDKKEMNEKLTCSKFLFEMLVLGFKAYKMNNKCFESAHSFLDSIKANNEKAIEKKQHKEALAAENVIEAKNLKELFKAKLSFK